MLHTAETHQAACQRQLSLVFYYRATLCIAPVL